MTLTERMARALAAQRLKDDSAAGLPIVSSRYDPPLPMDFRAACAALAAMREPDMNLCLQLGRKLGIAPAIIDIAWTNYIDTILGKEVSP